MLHLAFVRSPHAHAALGRVDIDGGARGAGRAWRYSPRADLARPRTPAGAAARRPGLHADANGRSWPRAWCDSSVSRSPRSSRSDAVRRGRRARAVQVDYEPLAGRRIDRRGARRGRRAVPAQARAATSTAASRGAPSSCARRSRTAADAPSPMEPRGVVARLGRRDAHGLGIEPDAAGAARRARDRARSAGEPRARRSCRTSAAASGSRCRCSPRTSRSRRWRAAWARPVQWIEERRESLAAASHAREQRMEAEVAADANGRLLALRARVVSDAGAYHVFPLTQALEPLGTAAILPGPYLTPAYAWEAIAVRHEQVAARRVPRRRHDDGRVRDGAPPRPRRRERWPWTRPRSAGAT